MEKADWGSVIGAQSKKRTALRKDHLGTTEVNKQENIGDVSDINSMHFDVVQVTRDIWEEYK